MTVYVLRYETDGEVYELGPDAYLGLPNWNKLEWDRVYILDTDDMAKIHNSFSREIDIPESAYTVPYVNKKIIQFEEFDGLYDEFRGLPNNEITQNLVKLKTQNFLLEQYYKNRYVLDPYDKQPIKRYEDIAVIIYGIDDSVSAFIKRKPKNVE